MTLKEQIQLELERLNDRELEQVAKYVGYLSLRKKGEQQPPGMDDEEMARLYAEFGDQDINLAEQGMHDYQCSLEREDEA